jgi:Protein of unknown function (DUF1236)
MGIYVRYGAIALALLGGASVAVAQVKFPTGVPGYNDNITVSPADRAASRPYAEDAGSSFAQDQTSKPVRLSAAKKAAIARAIMQQGEDIAPPAGNIRLARGAQVPSSIELYALPDNALAQAPEAQSYKYALVRNEVVLVDPSTMRIVDIIRR